MAIEKNAGGQGKDQIGDEARGDTGIRMMKVFLFKLGEGAGIITCK